MSESIKINCRDCKKPIGEYKPPFHIRFSDGTLSGLPTYPHNEYYCEECKNRVFSMKFFIGRYLIPETGESIQYKSSPGIEEMIDESLFAAKQAAANQYF